MANIFENNSNANRGNMHFVKTMTVQEFKNMMGIEKIDLIVNPNTSKVFFTYASKDGIKNGIVSTNGKGGIQTIQSVKRNPDGSTQTQDVQIKEILNPVISEVVFDETGEMAYMLHEQATASPNKFMSL